MRDFQLLTIKLTVVYLITPSVPSVVELIDVIPAGGFKKLMEAFDLERCGNSTMS